MKAYSQDLRERVIAAVEAGQQSRPEIAATFEVSESTIDKWVKRWRHTGSVAALLFAGGRRRSLNGCTTIIRAEVQRQPCLKCGARLRITAHLNINKANVDIETAFLAMIASPARGRGALRRKRQTVAPIADPQIAESQVP